MTTAPLLPFLVAVLLLCAAHVLRCYRQTLLFPDKLLPWRFDLLLGLALSQAVNVLVPWRAGDAVRVLFVALRYRLRISYVAATVLAERVSDIGVVVALAALLWALGAEPAEWLSAVVVSLSVIGVALVLFAAVVAHSAAVRRWLWQAASVFNANIQFGLLDLSWSFAQLVTAGSLWRRRFLLLTVAMWSLYLLSYAVVAEAFGMPVIDIGLVLLGGPGHSLRQRLGGNDPTVFDTSLFVFTALPVVAVLLYGMVRNSRQLWRQLGLVRDYGFSGLSIAEPIAGDRFSDRANYFAFLESHFAGSNAIVSKFGLVATADVLVHKLLPGGSDAVTALVEIDGALKIRKCASGGAGDKLEEQARWLRTHQGALPLCDVLGTQRNSAMVLFDMPYLLSARDFYEVIHTAPVSRSGQVLADVVEQVHGFHRRTARGMASDATIDAYLEQKVIANARQVQAFAEALFPDGRYRINGVEHDLAQWQVLSDLDWLRSQIVDRSTAVVHGDLTIENIIVSSEVERGWYLIDPNPSNVFDTPLIDWAKLMQSLHLGYEGLNRGVHSEVDGQDIRQLFLRSGAYTVLHQRVAAQLHAKLGAATMREIEFHEIVNYLRLTPYKIRHHPQKAVTFFACTSVLLNQYLGLQSAAWVAPDLVASAA